MRKKKLFKIILTFSLILAISACSIVGDSEEDDDWENEVLLASECGMDGLQCCVAPEEECKYGQECCHDPGNSSLNYCADDCTLGKEKAFCRVDEPACDESLACLDGRCVECGKEEEPCCYGDLQCNESLVCNNKTCEQCGIPGNVCCEENLSCLGQNLRERGRTECRGNNICSYCGYGGGVSCKNEPFCNSGHLLNGTTCFQCGDLNQPCCKINELNVFECNQEEQELKCDLGFCSKK